MASSRRGHSFAWSESTCGETTACAVRLRGGRLEAEARFDPDAPGVCDDCYSLFANCRLPALPAGATLPIRIGGASVGELHTGPDGSLAPTALRCRAD